MAKIKIGVFGSSALATDELNAKAAEVGEALAEHDAIVITGACAGLPYAAAFAAHKKGGEIWGYSAAVDLERQMGETPGDDNSIYSKLIYIPQDSEYAERTDVARKLRNVFSTAACDGAIIISGRWGTLNEFTNLYDMGKVIGILTGTGGIADELSVLSKKVSKPSQAVVLFNESPRELVDQVVKSVQKSGTK